MPVCYGPEGRWRHVRDVTDDIEWTEEELASWRACGNDITLRQKFWTDYHARPAAVALQDGATWAVPPEPQMTVTAVSGGGCSDSGADRRLAEALRNRSDRHRRGALARLKGGGGGGGAGGGALGVGVNGMVHTGGNGGSVSGTTDMDGSGSGIAAGGGMGGGCGGSYDDAYRRFKETSDKALSGGIVIPRPAEPYDVVFDVAVNAPELDWSRISIDQANGSVGAIPFAAFPKLPAPTRVHIELTWMRCADGWWRPR